MACAVQVYTAVVLIFYQNKDDCVFRQDVSNELTSERFPHRFVNT